MVKKVLAVAKGDAAVVPAPVWTQAGKDAPRLQDVLSQCAHFFEELGFDKTLKALLKETTDKHNIKINVDGWKSGPATLMSLWALHHDEKKAFPSLLAAPVVTSSSSSSGNDDSSDSDSDSSDEDIQAVGVTTTNQKRKREPTPSSTDETDDSSSASDSSDSDSDDVPPAKKQKAVAVAVAEDESSDASSSSSESDSEDNPMTDVVAKDDSSDSGSSSSESSSDSDTESSDSESESEARGSVNTKPPSSDSESSSSDSTSESEDSEPPAPKSKPKTKKVEVDPKEGSTASSASSATLVAEEEAPPATKKNKKASKKEKKAKIVEVIIPAAPEEENGGMHPDRMARLPNNVVATGTTPKGKKSNVPFSRIPADTQVDPRFSNNEYVSYDYADRAHQDLIVTRGKGFTKEKNKKKRGSYRGGAIDFTNRGIKFED
nr:isoform beta of nucleolar and coiled-body phosphoprotein 1 [Quercus suber]